MKPKINLCISNHLRRGILDQLWFAEEIFAQHGCDLICTDSLRRDRINLLIENFVEEDIGTLEVFCRRFRKQIGIVMSEHIELEEHGFTFNGSPLHENEYIGNKEQRLFSLLSITDCVFAFFTFGELPVLRTWKTILPSHQVYRLPYPSIQRMLRRSMRPDHDIVFTGAPTTYRTSVLREIGNKYRLIHSELGETEAERADIYARAKVAVNIPQTEDWKWISPMRILFGFRVGIPTVHLGRRDATMFSRLVLDPVDLDSAIEDPEFLFQRQIKSYESFVTSHHNAPFPASIFNLWAELELQL